MNRPERAKNQLATRGIAQATVRIPNPGGMGMGGEGGTPPNIPPPPNIIQEGANPWKW